MRKWLVFVGLSVVLAGACGDGEQASPGGSGGSGGAGGSGGTGGLGGDNGIGGAGEVDCGAIDFNCPQVCAHLAYLCQNGCNDGSLDCDLVGAQCELGCSAVKIAPPGTVPVPVLGAFNCATLESSCAQFGACVQGCVDEGSGGSGGEGGGAPAECVAEITDCTAACAEARVVCDNSCDGTATLCGALEQCEQLCGVAGTLPEQLRVQVLGGLNCALADPACEAFGPCFAACVSP